MCRFHLRFNLRVFLLMVVTLGVLGAAGVAVAEDFRSWSDVSGKFKIQAKFVSLEGDNLTLEKEDGTHFEIELNKLTVADQKVAKDLSKQKAEDPFKPKANDPFKPKAGAMKPKGGETSSSGEARLITPDWSNAQTVGLAPEKAEWSISAKPAPDQIAGLSMRPITLPAKANFFERTKGLVINAASKHAVVGYNLDDPKPKGTTRLVLCDLTTGKSLGTSSTSGVLIPLALHDDGLRVLMRRDEFGFGNADRLEVWKLGPKGIEKGIGWTPYDDLKNGDRDVKWAAFLDSRQLATVSNSGKLVVWDFESATPKYSLQLQGNCVPGLSPDRKLLAFTTGKEVGILDVQKGEVLALEETPPNLPFPNLAFSPTGKRFACLAMNRLYVWDLGTGKLDREISLLNLPIQGQIAWPNEDYILVGNHFLIDLVNQIYLWDYQGGELADSLGPMTYFVVSEGTDRPGALVGTKMPQPGAEATLKRALSDPNFFVLKSGSTVAIDVNALADATAREIARAALTSKLEANGVKVAPNAPLKLVATAAAGKQRDVSYRSFGGRGFPNSQSYKVTEYNSAVTFMYEGKQAWTTGSSNIPHMVNLKEGQTMEQYLRDHEKPNYEFFNFVELPKLLTRPNGQMTLGQSKVSTAGVR